MSSYTILIGKLDEFIRKYYKNQLLRGAIYASALILVSYLSLVVMEYFGHFGVGMRTVMFWSLVAAVSWIVGTYIVIPLMRLNKLGKIITYEMAAQIIGHHFSEVSDKLLNVLQLSNSRLGIPGSKELVEAAIDQKIGQLKPIPFTSAIDLSHNKRYLKYAALPLSVFLLLIIVAPGMIFGPTQRLVEHRTFFEKESPFKFEIQNEPLIAVQQEDYVMQLKLTGQEIPEAVYIEIDGVEFRMNRENTVNFNYTFRNVQNDIHFKLNADGFSSAEEVLTSIPNPVLLSFEVDLKYPKYIGKQDETLKNTGDIIIPAGTKVTWRFSTKNTSTVDLRLDDSLLILQPAGEDLYSFSGIPAESMNYSVRAGNEKLKGKDSVAYTINVIQDLYPAIDVDEKKDSVSLKKLYFTGDVKDDHGFTRLAFCYLKLNADRESKSQAIRINIPVGRSVSQDHFYHFWDLTGMTLEPGDQFEYYFEISDNDGVHGPKTTRSQKQLYKVPTLDELSEHTDKNNEEIKADLEESIKKAKELQKEIDALNKKLLEKKELNWEEKKKLENMLDKQKELQKQVEEIKKQNELNNEQKSEFQNPDEKLMEKQKELEKLFESIMNEELKKKFEELQKLMDQVDKNELQKKLEEMKLDSKDMEKELDRALEMFKQLQFEEKLDDNIKKLEELAKKQEELSKKTEEKNANKEELQKKQEELNKEMDELRKDMDELEKLNKELEKPNPLENTDKQEQDIQNEQKNSSDQLEQNKKKDASKSQKKAGQQMKSLADQLSSMMAGMEMEQQSEDMNNLRQILSNLIQLSFDQEALMKNISKTKISDPNYVKLTAQQKKLKDDARIIEDSLLALSKRVFSLQNTVNKEISSINSNMEKSIEDFAERMTSSGLMRQQYVMTSLNNLALLLSEALNQMQQQMQNQMSGSGSCTKPGGNGQKPSMSQMRKMQESLNKQIEEMKKALEGGKKPGQKPGQKPGEGGGPGGMNESIVKLAAQQEMLRKMMQQMMNEGGNTPGDMKNTLKKMEETETDLVNKMLTKETMMRQQQILDKLLDYEKAEKQKETEQKRLAEQPKNEENRNQSGFLEYNKQKEKEAELLKTVPPSLKPFYKNKVTEYFNKFE